MDIIGDESEAEPSKSNDTEADAPSSAEAKSEAAEGIFRGHQVEMDSQVVVASNETSNSHETASQRQVRASPIKQHPQLTPAVRHLLKQNSIDPHDVTSTGKDGRITKEDVVRHLEASAKEHVLPQIVHQEPELSGFVSSAKPLVADQKIPLSPVERQMFKAMSLSLTIPHFLYSHTIDVSALNRIRRQLQDSHKTLPGFSPIKLSLLPFVMKALSQTFLQHPRLNSHLDLNIDSTKPHLIIRSAHNFGIAVETPHGLLVPVVRNVQDHSVVSLAREIQRLADLGKAGKLAPEDFQGATFTVSNIGSIGGGVVSPVIVAPMIGILGVGKAQQVPVYQSDNSGVGVQITEY
ncbi:hypothetical protein LTS08_007817 [Lithohypha guttulata]|nr:hypothetical protein LTS08_007817 [Lithohypha guttulata]